MTEQQQILQELVSTTPVAILALNSKEAVDFADSLLPYSTGFEIECNKSINYDLANFTNIPDIFAIENDDYEQRYRIPIGLKGLICLYNICYQLKLNSELNYGSGIHYHIDCTGHTQQVAEQLISRESKVLRELDTWGYSGSYNGRGLNTSIRNTGNWIRQNSLGTIEFRIGEMAFDYPTLFKRIVHCNSIIKNVKDEINIGKPIYQLPDVEQLVSYHTTVNLVSKPSPHLILLNKQLNKLNQLNEEEKLSSEDLIRQIVKGRVHKIN